MSGHVAHVPLPRPSLSAPQMCSCGLPVDGCGGLPDAPDAAAHPPWCDVRERCTAGRVGGEHRSQPAIVRSPKTAVRLVLYLRQVPGRPVRVALGMHGDREWLEGDLSPAALGDLAQAAAEMVDRLGAAG